MQTFFFFLQTNPHSFFTTWKSVHLHTFGYQIDLSAMKNNGARNFDVQTF